MKQSRHRKTGGMVRCHVYMEPETVDLMAVPSKRWVAEAGMDRTGKIQ